MPKKDDRLQLGKVNFIILGVAAVLLIIGYIIMAANEIVVSPLILIAAYVVLIPLALLYKSKPKD
jgi:dipeptide/tripeptide permease